jgi:hypothetical protein
MLAVNDDGLRFGRNKYITLERRDLCLGPQHPKQTGPFRVAVVDTFWLSSSIRANHARGQGQHTTVSGNTAAMRWPERPVTRVPRCRNLTQTFPGSSLSRGA